MVQSTHIQLFSLQVVCIVPNNRKDRYDAIKKYCCVDDPGRVCNFFYYRLRSSIRSFWAVSSELCVFLIRS